jgi:hypothetical protein
MSLTYTSYVSQVANLMVVPTTDPNFQTMLPGMLDYAELRMQRDLDLVDSSVQDTTGTFTVGTRSFTLPTDQGNYITVDQMNVLTPVGSTTADSATRVPLVKCSIGLLDALWPSSTGSTVPQYFSMIGQGVAIVGPFPDQAYNVEVIGNQRFTPLYVSQTTSPLSVFFPDLLVAASMVFASGYQRNFGAGSDDPKMAVTWESQYQTLLTSAQTEEARKKFLIGDTTPQPATPKG